MPEPSRDWERLFAITRHTESRNRDHDDSGNILKSPVGAMGRMQVMPGTARDPGWGIKPWNGRDLDDLARVGEEMLRAMVRRYNGDLTKAWAAYNWGPGNVDKAIKRHGQGWLRNAPKETRDYVRKNMGMLTGNEFNPDSSTASTPPPRKGQPLWSSVRSEMQRRQSFSPEEPKGGEELWSSVRSALSSGAPRLQGQQPATEDPEASGSDLWANVRKEFNAGRTKK